MDPRQKAMRIKTGVLKRTCKETISYQTDATKIQEKIKKMQDDGEDIYYIKKQDQLLQETNNVVLDCQKRMNNAYADLEKLMEEMEEPSETAEEKEREIYTAAQTVLKDSLAHINK